MKFDTLYSKLLREMNVAGGDGVFGAAAGDGDMSTGWTADDNIYSAMALFGTDQEKKENKKNKKTKKSKKTKPTIQRRPGIGTI
jgi:hypothetical protein